MMISQDFPTVVDSFTRDAAVRLQDAIGYEMLLAVQRRCRTSGPRLAGAQGSAGDPSAFFPRLVRLASSLLRSSLIRYLLVGVANTVLGYSIIYGSMLFLRAGYVTANIAGYWLGFLLSFVLNRLWTFRSDARVTQSLIRFAVVMGAAYLANLGTVVALVDWFQVDVYMAQAAGLVPYLLTGYVGSRIYAFASASGAKRDHR